MGAGASSARETQAKEKIANGVYEAVVDIVEQQRGDVQGLTWAYYLQMSLDVFGDHAEGRTGPAVQLVEELTAAARTERAEQPMERTDFVDLHVRCGQMMSVADFQHFGAGLVSLLHTEDSPETAYDAHASARARAVGGDVNSDDEM